MSGSILRTNMDSIRANFRDQFGVNTGIRIWNNDVRLAAHEAGHAVVALLSGLGVGEVTIEPRDGNDGHCCIDWPDAADDDGRGLVAISRLRCTVAGEEAEAFLDGALRGWGRGLGGDGRCIRDDLASAGWEDASADVLDDLLRRIRRDVRADLERHTADIDRLAMALLRWRTLDGAEVRAIVPRLAALGDARREALEGKAGRSTPRQAATPAIAAARPTGRHRPIGASPGREYRTGTIEHIRY